jgi:hypothetical protein
MRAVVCLLVVLSLAAARSAVAQEKHLIDPMLPGSLDPRPLPPLKNPDAPSTPAKELFARKSKIVRHLVEHDGTCAMPRVTLPEQIEPFATEREFEQAEAGEIMSHNLGLRDS